MIWWEGLLYFLRANSAWPDASLEWITTCKHFTAIIATNMNMIMKLKEEEEDDLEEDGSSPLESSADQLELRSSFCCCKHNLSYSVWSLSASASIRINQHQSASASIRINQWQCANVIVNQKENLCILAKMLKISKRGFSPRASPLWAHSELTITYWSQ